MTATRAGGFSRRGRSCQARVQAIGRRYSGANEGLPRVSMWSVWNEPNHPQFIQVPPKSVNGTQPGRFLNRDFTDSGIRSI